MDMSAERPKDLPKTVAEPAQDARRLVRPVLVVLVIVGAIAGLYLSSARLIDDERRVTVLPDVLPATPSLEALPPSIAGYALSSQLTGPEAVSEISNLHLTGFQVDWAEVGWYGDGQVASWASRGAADGARATKLVDRMAARIGEGDTPFSTPEEVAGLQGVWATEGAGQVHYFFAAGDTVWWLSADPGLGESALTEVLGGFP
jgi:hypothetical protein